MVLELESQSSFQLGKICIEISIKSLNILGEVVCFKNITYPWRTLYGGKKNLVPSELLLHSISSLAFAKSKSS